MNVLVIGAHGNTVTDEPATVGKVFTLFEGTTPLRDALRSLDT